MILLKAMLEQGVYTDEISKWNLETAALSARLHDVGKITISDSILNKTSGLTEEEYKEMKSHTWKGEEIIELIIKQTGEQEFLSNAKKFAGYHHEHWDGAGYPYGLHETDIPLQGRIMTIVDVYDALVSTRPYKKAYSDDEAIDMIMADAGKKYDPKITDVFFAARYSFKEKKLWLR
jgi:putative two-component system response regulator